MPVHEITNPDDERIADYRALTDVELRTRWKPPHGLFIAEGELVLRRALRAGYPPRSSKNTERRGAALPPPAGGDRCQRPGHVGQLVSRCIPCRSEALVGAR